jgi:hypothetical protein
MRHALQCCGFQEILHVNISNSPEVIKTFKYKTRWWCFYQLLPRHLQQHCTFFLISQTSSACRSFQGNTEMKMSAENRWNNTDKVKQNYSEENISRSTLSTTDLIRTGSSSNTILCQEKPKNKRLSQVRPL